MLTFLFLFVFLPLFVFTAFALLRGFVRLASYYPRSTVTDPGCWIESIAETDEALAKRLGHSH